MIFFLKSLFISLPIPLIPLGDLEQTDGKQELKDESSSIQVSTQDITTQGGIQ